MSNADKYKQLKYAIQIRMHCSEFRENIAEKIIELEDIEKVKKYNKEKWQELYDITSDNLKIAMLKCKYLPKDIKRKMIQNGGDNILKVAFSLEHNDYEDVLCMAKRLVRMVSPEKKMRQYTISDSTLKLLCDLPDGLLRMIHYEPYRLIAPNYNMDIKITKKLDKENIDEYFTTAIANNHKMHGVSRDKAFDIAYVPYEAEELGEYQTKHMLEEMYKMYTDVLFSKDIRDMDTILKADKLLGKIAENCELIEEQQRLFIHKAKEGYFSSWEDTALGKILYNTKSQQVLREAIDVLDKEYIHLIERNPNLCDLTLEKLDEKMGDITETYFLSHLDNNINYQEKTYIKYLTDENDYIILSSLSTPSKIVDKMIEDANGKSHYQLFCCMRFLRNVLKSSQILQLHEKVILMNSFTAEIIGEENFQKTHSSVYLNDFYNYVSRRNSVIQNLFLNEKKYNEIIRILDSTSLLYPNSSDIVELVKTFVDDEYEKQKFFDNYPELFSYETIDNMKVLKINMEKLCAKNSEDNMFLMERLLSDVRKINDNRLLNDLNLTILKGIIKANDESLVHKYIYFCADLYNEINKTMDRNSGKENPVEEIPVKTEDGIISF